MTLLIFIAILSLLVLVHEFGHFIAAKKNGVKVEEFGLGLPPRFFGKQIGETLYSLNVLPFGGFVKLLGEDEAEGGDITTLARNFVSKTPFQRAIILSAGVLMNFILAFVLYYSLFFANNFKTLNIPLLFDYKFRFGTTQTIDTVITGMVDTSAFSAKGIKLGSGMEIIAINGQPIASVQDIRAAIGDKIGKDAVVVLRDLKNPKTTASYTVTVLADKDNHGILGVYLGKWAQISYANGSDRLLAPLLHSYNMVAYSANVFANLIGMSFSAKSLAPVSEGVSGPVGIYSAVGSILQLGGETAILSLLDFIALMSLNLAIINILPFPALDGGRLFFVIIEGVRKKKVSQELEANVHKWGMLVLLGLIVLISIKDVFNLF